MKLSYGGYDFDDDELRFGWDRSIEYSPVNRVTKYKYTMLVRGVREVQGATAMTVSLGLLEGAMSTNNQDLTFLDNSGNDTVHTITAASTMNGVIIDGGVKYPIDPYDGSKTEYLNKRTFEVLFRWEVEAPESEIVSWDQDIQTSLGSEFVVKRSLSGLAQQQTTSFFPDYVGIQQGRAVGWSGYPSFPTYQFSSGLVLNGRSYNKKKTPLYRGRNGDRLYPIEWRYYYWSPVPLTLVSPSLPVL